VKHPEITSPTRDDHLSHEARESLLVPGGIARTAALARGRLI
jgi:hypothetical protein